MRQAGRYLPEYRDLRSKAKSFLDFCYTPEMATEATMQPVRRFALDAAILFSDILVVPDALGVEVGFSTGHGPRLTPITSNEAVAALQPGAVEEQLAPVYETVKRVRAALPENIALIGFAGAPWTVATYMVEGGGSKDFATVKRWALGAAEEFSALIEVLTEATIGHLLAQIRAGADVVQIFDSWAGALPADAIRRWCIAPMRVIVIALRALHPEVPIIGFPRGIGAMLGDYVYETGVSAVGLDSGMGLAWAVDTVGDHCVIQGNLDPVYLLAGGEAMRAAADRVLAAVGDKPHVFNLGHGVLPPTPPENVAELIEIVRARR